MNYTILIYEGPADFARRVDADAKKRAAYWAEWPPYSQALKDAGVFVGGAGLQPPETATHEEGTVGACHGFEKDTAACRFYITLGKYRSLDGNFTVFGKVTRGLDVARKIFEQPVIISPEDVDNSRRPEKPVVMQKVTIHTRELDR